MAGCITKYNVLTVARPRRVGSFILSWALSWALSLCSTFFIVQATRTALVDIEPTNHLLHSQPCERAHSEEDTYFLPEAATSAGDSYIPQIASTALRQLHGGKGKTGSRRRLVRLVHRRTVEQRTACVVHIHHRQPEDLTVPNKR